MVEKTLGEIAFEVGYDMPYSSAESWQAVADAVIQAHEARRWKPIETAPKDGTSILIYIPAFKEWTAIVAQSHFYKAGRGKGYWWDFANMDPTHWTAIPAPPTKEGE